MEAGVIAGVQEHPGLAEEGGGAVVALVQRIELHRRAGVGGAGVDFAECEAHCCRVGDQW